MARYETTPTTVERTFGEDEIIVSKTDEIGRITYANDVFLQVALYDEHELLGQPHSVVRHPDMPRAVFKLLWDTIRDGHEIFAYVKNMAKNGDYYWAFAHVTPSYDIDGNIIGFHSNRRCPDRAAIEKIEPIYQKLVEVENHYADRKQGMQSACDVLAEVLADHAVSYDEFVFSL